MRVEYMQAIISAEISLETLTPKEQIDFLLDLIKDINTQYPEYNLRLIRTENIDNSLDW